MWPLQLWDSKMKWNLKEKLWQKQNVSPIHHAPEESWFSGENQAVGVWVGVQEEVRNKSHNV